MRITVILSTLCAGLVPGVAGCASGPAHGTPNGQARTESRPAPVEAAPQVSMAPFVETIPGTNIKIEFVPVPGGVVEVPDGAGGSTRTTVAPFYIAKTETTWDAFDVFIYGFDLADPNKRDEFDGVTYPTRPYISTDRGFGHAGYPAISLSYKNALNFAAWMAAKTKKKYRLPKEAEFRLAALGPAGATFPTGSALTSVAWLKEECKGKTQPVATKQANALGVHDLIGNVAEWCTAPDGKPVSAGGHFLDSTERIQNRFRVMPIAAWNASDPNIPKSVWWLADAAFAGFRLVCEL